MYPWEIRRRRSCGDAAGASELEGLILLIQNDRDLEVA